MIEEIKSYFNSLLNKKTFTNGHYILFVYFALFAFLPMTEFHNYDYLAIIGNLLLINESGLNKFGYIASIIFYLFSAKHYLHDLSHYDLKAKLAGVLILIYYYTTRLIHP